MVTTKGYDEAIAKMWNAGSSVADVARRFGLSYKTAENRLYKMRKAGVELRNGKPRQKIWSDEETARLIELYNDIYLQRFMSFPIRRIAEQMPGRSLKEVGAKIYRLRNDGVLRWQRKSQ